MHLNILGCFGYHPATNIKKAVSFKTKLNTTLVMDALALKEIPELFDVAIDSGLFHVFSDADRVKYAAGLRSVLKPGGRLFLLCFSDAEPGEQGPRRVSRAELEACFAAGWKIESLGPARFDVRSDSPMEFSPGGPHAWFLIARRTA